MTTSNDDDEELRDKVAAGLRKMASEMSGPVTRETLLAEARRRMAGAMDRMIERANQRELELPAITRRTVDVLAPLLSAAGLMATDRAVPRDAVAWERSIEGGRQELLFGLTAPLARSTLAEIRMVVSVRLDAVERARCRTLGLGLPAPGAITTRTGLHIIASGTATGARGFWTIETKDDLEGVVDSVRSTVQEKALPFLEAHRDVAALNAGCNPPGAENDHRPVGHESFSVGDWQRFNAMGTPARQIHALVLAHLAGDPRVSALARAYTAQVSTCVASERATFERLVAGLFAPF